MRKYFAAAALSAALVSGLGIAASPAEAATASAASIKPQTTCSYTVTTRSYVYALPNDTSYQWRIKNPGDIVTGPCVVAPGTDGTGNYFKLFLAGGGYGYISTQFAY